MAVALAVLLADTSGCIRDIATSIWPFTVLVLDALLVMRARREAALAIVAATVLWLCIRGWITASRYHAEGGFFTFFSFALINMVVTASVLVGDFHFAQRYM